MQDRSQYFDERFKTYYPRIYRFALTITGDAQAADDIAQETFVTLYIKPPPRDDDIGPWLSRVARNLALNYLRHEKRRNERERKACPTGPSEAGPGGVWGELPEDDIVARENSTLVRTALARLTERERTLLLMRHAGFTYRDIAAALGISPSSVGKLTVRAMERFQSAYKEVIGDEVPR